jgi:hypothetical protein
MTGPEMAAAIGKAWEADLLRTSRLAQPHPYVYASAWRPCDRRLVYEMTCPELLPPFDANVLAKFRRGEDRERDLVADLVRVGRNAEPPFQVFGQQEAFTLRDTKGRKVISGKVDCRIQVSGQPARPPLEVKAWSPQIVDRVETFADLFEGVWTRSGAYQLLAYLYGAGEELGFILLDRSGLPKLIPVTLYDHLDELTSFLARAERALDHVEANTLPDYLQGEAAECKRCPWFGGVCQPPLSATGAVVLTDPDLEAELEARASVEEAAHTFEALDKGVKQKLRGVEVGVCGKFTISGKWGKSTRVELPDELKAQYTKTDPKGKFTLKIERIG